MSRNEHNQQWRTAAALKKTFDNAARDNPKEALKNANAFTIALLGSG